MPTRKVLIFQRILPDYRIPVFRYICKRSDALVLYSDSRNGSSLESRIIDDQNFIRLKRLYFGTSETCAVQNPVNLLFRYNPEIVVTEGAPSYLTLWLLILFRLFFRFKLIVWSHGVRFNEMNTPFSTLRSKLQLWIFNRADAVLIYSDNRAEIVKAHINLPQKIFVARNTLDTDHYKMIFNDLNKKGKHIVKSELGFTHYFNIIYIGRLLSDKAIKDLINAFRLIYKDFDIALHIIGDGPEMSALKTEACNNPNIIFYGSVFDSIYTAKLIYSSDLFVIPGYAGLSVIHGFAFGCPILTYLDKDQSWPVHSPEVEYIRENENGVFCSPGIENLAESIRVILSDPLRLKSFSEKALDTAYNYASISKMYQGFSECIEYVNQKEAL